MKNFIIEDIIIMEYQANITAPNDASVKKEISIEKEISGDFSDDLKLFGAFTKIKFLVKKAKTNEELVSCTFSYFVPVVVEKVEDKEKCSNEIIEKIVQVIEIQYLNDINYILSRARYPSISLSNIAE